MLNRAALASVLVFAAAACGSKNPGQDLCKQIPAPAACMTQCDPSPGAQNSCPTGYHCTPDGTCDAFCTPNGNQCGDGYTCTMDGQCVGTGGSNMMPLPDADCPSVHFSPTKTTPSIELLLDRSGSMGMNDISPTRYDALHTALTGAMGAITQAQGEAYFGAALFSGDESPCPPNAALDGKSVPRALNNQAAIDGLISANSPGGSTPTADWVTAVAADFAANPPPSGSPPIILLATDGEPNACGNGNDNGRSVAATMAAYTNGIRLFIIGLQSNGAPLNPQFLQDMANAGAGVAAGQPNAPYYTANDPASLVSAFNTIINGVLSCDLQLSGSIDPSQAMSGQVTLNGMTLTYGTDWTLDPNGMTIHIIGSACDTLKNSPNPTVDAAFPCGAVIGRTVP
jgi:hypothetical protein